MIVSIIVAMDRRGVIGKDGGLPWRLPKDLRWFARHTSGHHVIMGRRTFESLPGLLRDRTHVVLTRSPERIVAARATDVEDDAEPRVVVCTSLEEALQWVDDRGEDEVFIIGGAAVYAAALEHADRIYRTLVDASVEGDTYFPPLQLEGWNMRFSEIHPADDRHAHPFEFQIFERGDSPSVTDA